MSNGDGCGNVLFGCAFVYLLCAVIVAGVKGCVSGDIKIPKYRSNHVGGGSGYYGTSNGSNVYYNQTTIPNYNSTNRVFHSSITNPTKERESKESAYNKTLSTFHNSIYSQTASNNSISRSSTTTSSNSFYTYNSLDGNSSNSNNTFAQQKQNDNKPCPLCNGKGKRKETVVYSEFALFGSKNEGCDRCSRQDTHTHEYEAECWYCDGKGIVESMKEIINLFDNGTSGIYESSSANQKSPNNSSSCVSSDHLSAKSNTSIDFPFDLLQESRSNNYNYPSQQQKIYQTCPHCSGTGKIVKKDWHYDSSPWGANNASSCWKCDRQDTHYHEYEDDCWYCGGKGKYEVSHSLINVHHSSNDIGF